MGKPPWKHKNEDMHYNNNTLDGWVVYTLEYMSFVTSNSYQVLTSYKDKKGMVAMLRVPK